MPMAEEEDDDACTMLLLLLPRLLLRLKSGAVELLAPALAGLLARPGLLLRVRAAPGDADAAAGAVLASAKPRFR